MTSTLIPILKDLEHYEKINVITEDDEELKDIREDDEDNFKLYIDNLY